MAGVVRWQRDEVCRPRRKEQRPRDQVIVGVRAWLNADVVVCEPGGEGDEQAGFRLPSGREGIQAGQNEERPELGRPGVDGDAVTKVTPVSGLSLCEELVGQEPETLSPTSPCHRRRVSVLGGPTGPPSTEDRIDLRNRYLTTISRKLWPAHPGHASLEPVA